MKKILRMVNIELMGGAVSVTMYGINEVLWPTNTYWEWSYKHLRYRASDD